MSAVDGLVVTELTLTDWLHAAFRAERAPQRPAQPVARGRWIAAGRIVGGARASFWWMLGITLLAIALR
jgi:hypothetical protein